jgi:hypothetical protein
VTGAASNSSSAARRAPRPRWWRPCTEASVLPSRAPPPARSAADAGTTGPGCPPGGGRRGHSEGSPRAGRGCPRDRRPPRGRATTRRWRPGRPARLADPGPSAIRPHHDCRLPHPGARECAPPSPRSDTGHARGWGARSRRDSRTAAMTASALSPSVPGGRGGERGASREARLEANRDDDAKPPLTRDSLPDRVIGFRAVPEPSAVPTKEPTCPPASPLVPSPPS